MQSAVAAVRSSGVANWLHYNRGKKAWKYVADVYAVMLLYLAISGIFMIKGRLGLKWRGAMLVSAGIAIPLGYVLVSGGPEAKSSEHVATTAARPSSPSPSPSPSPPPSPGSDAPVLVPLPPDDEPAPPPRPSSSLCRDGTSVFDHAHGCPP